MDALLPWANIATPLAWGGALVFLRVMACLTMMPDIGDRTVSMRVRVMLGLVLTVALDAGLGVVAVAPPEHTLMMLPVVAREIVLGAALGLAVRLIYAAIQVGGDIAGINMGLSLDVLFNAASGEQQLALGRLFGVIATLFFFALGGHLIVTATLFEHLRAFPVGDGAFALPSTEVIAEVGVHMMRSAVLLAAPVLAVTLILNMAMGFIMRVVPSINIFGVGLSILMIGGFVAMSLEGEAVRLFIEHELDALPERMFELSGVLPGGP
ncbi:MAG: hypothetical protein CVU56_25145 [Deltaproteobacteria bacterium HGW-Deltaproteobacteria-14]|nr:MAG: hypothetical protein CVU56_25145 [Deltaproteobacteria bacterium HGW-Deltaproteobacteria-14]